MSRRCVRRCRAELKQRDIFLESEGDAWFERNPGNPGSASNPGSPSGDALAHADPLLAAIVELPADQCGPGTTLLEIGCGSGARLGWLKENRGFNCSGVDPSARAIAAAKQRGVAARQGTAERLAFADREFDIVAFGFCLYLCDREDLFRIAAEADRVLRDPGWLLILDFYSPGSVKREYHHRSGLFSYKMDYRALFAWHPAYTCYSHRVRHHVNDSYTDDSAEWVATSVLRKRFELGV